MIIYFCDLFIINNKLPGACRRGLDFSLAGEGGEAGKRTANWLKGLRQLLYVIREGFLEADSGTGLEGKREV